MASLYAPRLTRWSVAMGGGVVNDCVEYEGKPLFFRREDCRRIVADDEEDTSRDCLEIGGKVFLLMDKKMVLVLDVGGDGGRKAVRCVEYVEDDGSVLLLTVTEGEKEVAEVDTRDGGEVRVVVCGGYYDGESGTVQHVVDVQGAREAYMLLVSVRQELGRITRLN